MIHSRGARASDAEIVWTQILQGAGGFSAVASQVGAQASVPHADVAMVTAVVLLLTEIGGAVGSAIAGAIWSGMMPGNLRKALPELSEQERKALFGSIMDVLKYPRDHPIREGVIAGSWSAFFLSQSNIVYLMTYSIRRDDESHGHRCYAHLDRTYSPRARNAGLVPRRHTERRPRRRGR